MQEHCFSNMNIEGGQEGPEMARTKSQIDFFSEVDQLIKANCRLSEADKQELNKRLSEA